MSSDKMYNLPVPIMNDKEKELIDDLAKRYEKLLKPGVVQKTVKGIGGTIGKAIPQKVKGNYNDLVQQLNEIELYKQVMKVVTTGFCIIEEQAARFSVSEKGIIKKINQKGSRIEEIEEICLIRSYDIAKIVNSYKVQDLGFAFIEGGATGFFGFAGLPFNIVLSFFLYFRAVQSIALYYGYDVKDDAGEMVIASEVFMKGFSPNIDKGSETIAGIIGKMMVMTKATVLKESVKKSTYTQMAKKGGVELLFVQIRALANKAAQKALQNAGAKNLEKSIFSEMLEQLGKRMTQKVAQRAIPFIGAAIGAAFDTAYMKKILDFADIFYHKRFLLEKEYRIKLLQGSTEEIIDI